MLLTAGVLRLSALDFGLPNLLTRPDEAPVLELVEGPARGDFDLGWSVYPSAYVYLCWAWGEATLPVVRALGLPTAGDYRATLRQQPARVLLLHRLLSAVAGVAAVFLVMLLGRRCWGDAPALAAGWLLATCFLHVRDSHAAKPDSLLALGVTASFVAMLPLCRRATLRAGALAGLAVGLSMAMKYPGFLLLVPVYLACVLQPGARGWRRALPAPAILAGVVAAAVFLLTSPYLLLSQKSIEGLEATLFLVFPMLSPEATARVAAAELPHAALHASGSPVWWGGFFYHAGFSLWYGVGKPATLLAPVAIVWALLGRQRMPVLLASFVVAYFVVVGLSPTAHLARYVTPLLPPLLLLEAGALHAAARRFVPGHAGAALLLTTALLSAPSLSSTLAHDRILSRTDTRLLATRWLRENVAPGERVAVHGTWLYPWGAPRIPASLQPVAARPEASDLAKMRVRYLVVHDHELAYSTADEAALERLAPRLTLVAEFRPFDPSRASPVFEASDAYYVPFHGFSGVERGGPRIRIYRFE